MKTTFALLLIASTALADPPRGDFAPGAAVVNADPPAADVPLADPDAHGKAVVLRPGQTYTATAKSVVLDEQEDVSRERDRVRAHTEGDEWRRIAIGSITAGAVVSVTLALLGGLAAAHKL